MRLHKVFTLIEMAIVVVLVGTLASYRIKSFSVLMDKSRTKVTKDNIQLVTEGVAAHVALSHTKISAYRSNI